MECLTFNQISHWTTKMIKKTTKKALKFKQVNITRSLQPFKLYFNFSKDTMATLVFLSIRRESDSPNVCLLTHIMLSHLPHGHILPLISIWYFPPTMNTVSSVYFELFHSSRPYSSFSRSTSYFSWAVMIFMPHSWSPDAWLWLWPSPPSWWTFLPWALLRFPPPGNRPTVT